ncbi:hypothetical protein CP358_04620 [Lactobacillus sp. UMNPBX7]|nr:hypothetical protein CP364_01755 [Lactobacillus sp. UMNPBX13]PEH00718.1 hypothetical protein CP358_04620 [Lactobacillus sp. UMNPBX7]
MAENSQLSDETKNNSTDTSSTDASSAVIGNHENAVVPHKISNHDKLVQTMVMVDGEWINVNDTNDQANMKEDVHKVNKKVVEAQKGIVEAKNAADSAVKYADSAVSASKVNSDAIAAQSSAIIEAKSAVDSATAEIQQLKANAASDVAQIRADVAQVQNEVDTAKAANSASVDKLKSDIGLAQKDLDNVHDSLTKAQSAVEQNQKLINDSVTKINSDIAQSRQDIITAQQANNDLTKQLDTYYKEAQEQGKTIKTIQDNQDGFSITIADVKGDVTKVSDTVDGLSAGLKDAQGNIASVKAQADQLNVTLTDHSKNINQLIATAKELSSTLKDADGRLSKVEQTAKEHSSTLSGLQGNLTQVRQTADGLVTTLKDTQGNIDQIKQDAKGTLEQLSNVQGDVTALQKDVSGIKLTIADHDKNIHTLQADSKSLHDDMKDAQGNISSLQKTATSLDSEFKDHNGRISKVEQTASELINEFSDQQGHLNQVEQTAQGTQQTVANQQGQINTIKTDAAGIHQALTGQGNQIANINVTLSGLNTKYEGVSGDLNKLKDSNQWKTVTGAFDANQYTQTARIFYQDTQAKNTPNQGWFYLMVEAPETNRITQKLIKDNNYDSWSRFYNGEWSAWTKGTTQLDIDSLSNRITTNSTQITQNKQAIALKANQSTVVNLSGEVNQNKAQLKVQADQISSKVSSSDFKTLDNKVSGAIARINENATAIDQTNQKISLKADQTEVNQIKNTASHNSSRLDVMTNEIQSKVTSTDVNNIVDGKGYATTSTVQSLIDQKSNTISESIVKLSNDVRNNATVTQVQQITASIDGLQSTVANKADKSQITQLSNVIQSKVSSTDFNNLRKAVDLQTLESADANNLKTNGHYFVHNLANNPVGGWVYVDVTGNGNDRIRQDVYQDNGNKHKYRRWFGNSWTNWSEGATESEITQLRDDINLRVKKGDLLSQINIAAGRTLIQSNKIYFDADSFVMSPNSKAFIPSAYITNINADKITTGTLDAAKFNVKNFSADNIVGGTLNGVVVKTGANDRYFQTSKDNIYWVRNDDMSLVGNDTYLNRTNGLNIADMNNIQLTTWGGASVNPDGSIVNTSGNAGHPKIVVDANGNWDPDDPYGTKWGGGPGDSEIVQWIGNKEYTALTQGKGFTIHLNDGNNNSNLSIQKDNKVGFYVGQGENGNQVNVLFAGDGSGFNVHGNFNVYGAKNSAVKTSQGDVAVSAYETAEYYFGDIGEGQTGDSGIAFVGIEKLFSETVNTSIPYQVFITAYGPGNLWVDQREHDRFVVKSDRPNVKFGWEIKAKRRGYENTRLQKVN